MGRKKEPRVEETEFTFKVTMTGRGLDVEHAWEVAVHKLEGASSDFADSYTYERLAEEETVHAMIRDMKNSNLPVEANLGRYLEDGLDGTDEGQVQRRLGELLNIAVVDIGKLKKVFTKKKRRK